MKMILFASALALSTAAFAQDAAPAPTMPPADATAPATPDASTPPAAPDSTMAPATPDASTPPAADASAPAPAAAATDDSSLPMCSKTVTDKCKQGGKSTGHAHKAMHHKKK